jgi:flagellar hook protein FlgE
MLGTIYVGLAGMNAYSKGLDVISNNVANLNTAGFKAGVASFSDIVNRHAGGATSGSAGNGVTGAGVQVSTTHQNFSQGDLRDTNNPTDAALEGGGFFILERDGQRYYTRAGSFEFNKDGILTERLTGSTVMVSSDSSSLGSLNIDPHRTFAPRATTTVSLRGNLPRTGNATVPLNPLRVHDSAGTEHSLRAQFVRDGNDPLRWTFEVRNTTDQVIGSGQVTFNADGTPSADNVPISVTMTPDNVPPVTFTVTFGEAGTFAGMTSLLSSTGDTAVQVAHEDGLKFGTISATEFDERGNLEITYSNGEKKKIGRLVLASFDSGGDLQSLGDGLYITREGRSPVLSSAMEFGLGSVKGRNLELSNVELTDQFADLIIIQRGYQASSQMTSVANEMLQQLLSMQDRR